MYAPVVTRFLTYDVALDRDCAAYGERIMAWPAMAEWVAAAKREPEEPIHELEVEAEFCERGHGTARAPPASRPRAGTASGAGIMAAGFDQGVGRGTGQGPTASTVPKSAGPTTSRYSMSGE